MFKGIQGVLNKAAFKAHQELGDPSVVPIHKASEILKGERQQEILQKLPDVMQLDSEQFDTHCTSLIEHFAEFVQLIPETQNSYYAKSGGMLMHGLERACIAASLAKNYFVPKEELMADTLTQNQILWIYAVFSAGLLHDVGKVAVDIQVTLHDRHTQKNWNPFGGAMLGQAIGYKYEYSSLNQDLFRRRATLILARQLMPAHSFLWIASNLDVLAAWLGMLEDDDRSGGTLGIIITHADAEAIEGYFDRNRKENEKQLARLAENLLSDRTTSLGTFGKEKTSAATLGIDVGHDFLTWLKEAIQHGDIVSNQTDGKLARVTEGLFVNEQTIRDYVAARTGQDATTVSRGKITAVANSVETMKLHIVNQDVIALNQQQGTQQQQTQRMSESTHHFLNSDAANTAKAVVTGIILNNVTTKMLYGQNIPPEVHQNFVKVPAAAVVSANTMAQLTGNTASAQQTALTSQQAETKPSPPTPPPSPTPTTFSSS